MAWSKPMSRYEVTPVRPQKTTRMQQVVGQDQAQHRGHEGQCQRMEAVDLGMAVEVALGVQDDDRPDTADEQGEQERQPVE